MTDPQNDEATLDAPVSDPALQPADVEQDGPETPEEEG
jgi:hypothetical protein